jgi:NADPH:quinone reductase-like Zn-dependent oxidoreductase
LTTYAGFGSARFQRVPLDEIAQRTVDGSLKVPVKTFPFDQIVEAHRAMEENEAGSKIVVLL